MIRKCLILLLSLLVVPFYPQSYSTKEEFLQFTQKLHKSAKTASRNDRKFSVHNGNRILTRFYNYGGIGDWTISGRFDSGIYPIGSGRSYIAEFTPVIAASVVDSNGHRIHIVSDGMVSTSGKDISPSGYQWGFEPLPGYANPNQENIAMSDDPESWPETWPNRAADWDGSWNGQYGKFNRADQESYFVMDDYYNDEFDFFPDSTDLNRRGLGIELQVRGYQWSHPAAEDIIIWTYWITNRGTSRLDSVVFGMYGDADVGDDGDQRDDNASFEIENAIVYQWDSDNHSDAKGGFKPAYFGWKFLESPGNPNDGIDNDFDGMIDESQFDGIDNDGDWDVLKDDVGSDGIGPEHKNYLGPDQDGTENNGNPDPGEPNFEYLDNSESDQVGLTSFFAAAWPAITASDDELLWQQLIPGSFDVPEQNIDQTFLYGSGYFTLEPGEKKKFAVAMLFGEDRADILRNAVTMQAIYDADYTFAQPPDAPILTAAPGDRRVTLYWDMLAEQSRDPIYGRDFGGYRIYRSTDPAFIEPWVITDAWGNRTFKKPLVIFDLDDGLTGPHPVAFNGIQFDMGEDSGLRHSWQDSTIQNGQTYYYAITAFDKGYDDDFYERGLSDFDKMQPIQPAESPIIIDIDAGGNVLDMADNVVVVVPSVPSAGYVPPNIPPGGNELVYHSAGSATGKIVVHTVDAPVIPEGWKFDVIFTVDNLKRTSYDIINQQPQVDTVYFVDGHADLKNVDIRAGSVDLVPVGTVKILLEGTDFSVDSLIGRIEAISSEIQNGIAYQATYRHYVIKNSRLVAGESLNPVFYGMTVMAYNDELTMLEDSSGWIEGNAGYTPKIQFESKPYPADVEVRWSGSIGDSVSSGLLGNHAPFEVWNITAGVQASYVVIDNPANGRWDPEDLVYLLLDESALQTTNFSFRFSLDSLRIEEHIVDDSTVYDTSIIAIEPVESGDVLGIYTSKPFASEDEYRFTTRASYIDPGSARDELDRIAVVPNPYVVTASWEPKHTFVSGRGTRKIDFIRLPKECTIRIYTMSGQLLKTIHHTGTDEHGSEAWDLLSGDGMEIAYGIYLFHIEAPGIGERIGKFAVIK